MKPTSSCQSSTRPAQSSTRPQCRQLTGQTRRHLWTQVRKSTLFDISSNDPKKLQEIHTVGPTPKGLPFTSKYKRSHLKIAHENEASNMGFRSKLSLYNTFPTGWIESDNEDWYLLFHIEASRPIHHLAVLKLFVVKMSNVINIFTWSVFDKGLRKKRRRLPQANGARQRRTLPENN